MDLSKFISSSVTNFIFFTDYCYLKLFLNKLCSFSGLFLNIYTFHNLILHSRFSILNALNLCNFLNLLYNFIF